MLVHSWLDIVCLFRPYDALHTVYTSEFFSTEYFLVRSISSDTRVQRYHPTNKYIYIYICFKNVKMKQVCKGMVRFRRATNRLVFRQEFEARFIGRDIKVLATGVYIYIYSILQKLRLFQNTYTYLFGIALRFSYTRIFRSKLWTELLFEVS